MSHCKRLFSTDVLSFAVCLPAWAGDLPKRVGDCADTAIKSIGTRLEGVPDSGSAVSFENGGYQVGYDRVPAIEQSRNGDPVRMCLVSLTRNCPKGDDRGRTYRTTNLRKLEPSGFDPYVRRRVKGARQHSAERASADSAVTLPAAPSRAASSCAPRPSDSH